jgi:hypothetical protein
METLSHTPDQLMTLAADGRLSKTELASFLPMGDRQAFLGACARIEMRFTEACAANEPCLGAGCSCEGEICLQPLLRAESGFHKACAGVWLPLYRASHHSASQ